jgi:hypothetical protein
MDNNRPAFMALVRDVADTLGSGWQYMLPEGPSYSQWAHWVTLQSPTGVQMYVTDRLKHIMISGVNERPVNEQRIYTEKMPFFKTATTKPSILARLILQHLPEFERVHQIQVDAVDQYWRRIREREELYKRIQQAVPAQANPWDDETHEYRTLHLCTPLNGVVVIGGERCHLEIDVPKQSIIYILERILECVQSVQGASRPLDRPTPTDTTV